MIDLSDLLNRLEKVRAHGSYSTARCPAHADHSPSLSVRDMGDGIAVKCFSGCSTEDICKALGLDKGDLLADKDDGPKILDTYDYRDPAGEMVFQVVRYVPKAFRQRRPDGKGGWVWKLGNVTRIPYRLPELLSAISNGTPIFITEGERDAERLVREGLEATTVPGGAGAWSDHYARWFTGAHVAILGDNDEPGRNFARDVAASLLDVARSVRVLDLPDLPDGGDVTDWLRTRDVEELRALANATPRLEQVEVEGPVSRFGDSSFSELESWFRTADGIQVTVSDVTGSRGDWHGEVRITKGTRTVARSRINMTADQTVTRFCRRLDEQVAMPNGWESELPDLLWQVIDWHRTGETSVDLHSYEPEEHAGMTDPWWSASPVIWFGPGGSGKSYLALSLALEISTGECLVSGSVDRIGPVLFLDWESDPGTHSRRLRQLMAGHDLTRRYPVLYRKMKMPLRDALRPVLHECEQEGVVAVVLDSAGAARGGAPESAEETLKFYSALRQLDRPCGIVDHLAKSQFDRAANAAKPFGSIYSENAARSMWSVNTQWSEGHILLTGINTKTNDGARGRDETLRLDFTGGRAIWSLSDLPAVTDRSSVADRAAAAIAMNGPMSYKQLQDDLGVTAGSLRSAMNRSDRFAKMGDLWALH